MQRQLQALLGLRLTPTDTPPARRDTFFSWDVGARYKMNEHLQVGATYTYFRNWSTFDFSDFDRQGFSVDISSRY